MRLVAAGALVAIRAAPAAPVKFTLAVGALDGLLNVCTIDFNKHLVVLAAGACKETAVEQGDACVPLHLLAAGAAGHQVATALTACSGVHKISRLIAEE